jgi:hypothetical protein
MKTLMAFLLVASAAIAAAGADTATIEGKWAVHASVGGTDSDALCTFTQKETMLSGNCADNAGTFELNGKVDDKKITWSYKTLYNGSPLLVQYEGTWDPAGKMSGTVSVPDYAVSGEFSATVAK